MKLLEVEGGGARAPVPHSWRRHCLSAFVCYWSSLQCGFHASATFVYTLYNLAQV